MLRARGNPLKAVTDRINAGLRLTTEGDQPKATLHDQFAMSTMQGLLAGNPDMRSMDLDIADRSYKMADAMMK